MWTILELIQYGLIAEARERAEELGIVKIETLTNKNNNRFYLLGLFADDNGIMISFDDRVECLLTAARLANKLQLCFTNNL